MLATGNLQVLNLGKIHLLRVLAGSKHVCAGEGRHGLHLAGHLVRRVVGAENVVEDGAQAEEVQEVPGGVVLVGSRRRGEEGGRTRRVRTPI